ncbi:hypothetical protein GH714_036080 [Hevea brasiliensis]|uniref:Glucose-methanol-choline oxidoreductase N-terminal domain-containing protein n=1 Tax=Hevea brasiliensis TaxID=3981 RepID=A0A6A6NEI9_HEVBR|nr:hypothetical protein GH714_036080 [Hevea brasiliensis]
MNPSGKQNFYPFGYPFIKKASTFSTKSSSFSSIGGENAYDYIVVGGGTAGCPLAATLSQNFSVLLLERGGVPFANPNISYLSNFHMTLADTSPTSASQYFISTDGVLNSRGRVLGGGTSINAGFYTRASTRFIKKVGWDEKLVNESYPWVEKQIVHSPKVAPWQVALRDSLLDIGVSPFNGFTYDHVYGTKIGGTIFDQFGRRHTAAELLLSGNPQMLTVLVHATVQRFYLIHQGRVQRQWESYSKMKMMLLLSGIGPRAELKRMRIPLVLDNEFVGKGMADNPLNTIFVPSKRPVQQSLIRTVGITKFGVYIEASSGFGQSNDSIHFHHGMMSAEIGQVSTIPPKQRTPEAIQAYIKRKKDLPHEAFKGGFILEKLARPISTGHLSLINTNVDDNPSVTFNYFKHPKDLHRCVHGIRMATKVVQSEYFTNFTQCDNQTVEKILNMSVAANVNLVPKHPNDTNSLKQFCKDTVITIWHYHGGCHVGKVVTPGYRVIGIQRLRIVDGSTFDESPGTNPQGTVLMMGRYMGLKILRKRLGIPTYFPILPEISLVSQKPVEPSRNRKIRVGTILGVHGKVGDSNGVGVPGKQKQK